MIHFWRRIDRLEVVWYVRECVWSVLELNAQALDLFGV